MFRFSVLAFALTYPQAPSGEVCRQALAFERGAHKGGDGAYHFGLQLQWARATHEATVFLLASHTLDDAWIESVLGKP